MTTMTTREQSSCSGGGGNSGVSSSSPEFEFWMLRNPSSFPQTNLLSADELFSGGVLLPLRPPPPLRLPSESDPDPDPRPKSEPGPLLSSSSSSESSSKRWRDIFKKTDKKPAAAGKGGGQEDKEKEKKKKRERKSGVGASSAELNINLWPFSRSRSAGNSAGGRPRTAVLGGAGSRKVSSAPCSRSNSAGESNSRKWPCSPGRPGVHVGRSSPAWQVRRRRSEPPASRSASKDGKKEVSEGRRKTHAPASAAAIAAGGMAKARVLNLNVPMCIGYRHHSSCRADENSFSSAAAGEGGRSSSSHFFSLRGLFAKKVY